MLMIKKYISTSINALKNAQNLPLWEELKMIHSLWRFLKMK